MHSNLMLAVAGGVLIGLAAVWLYASLGRIAGISGILGRVIAAPWQVGWPVWFLLGLGAGGWIGLLVVERPDPGTLDAARLAQYAAAGLLVGFGTRLGSGCTSGHGVCGMARLSKRSIVATATYVAVGMVVATGFAP